MPDRKTNPLGKHRNPDQKPHEPGTHSTRIQIQAARATAWRKKGQRPHPIHKKIGGGAPKQYYEKHRSPRRGCRGAGGCKQAPCEWRRGFSPEHDISTPRPTGETKNVTHLRALGQRGRGANLASLRERGNPLTLCTQNTALAERNPRSDTAVPTVGRAPVGGVPYGAAVAPAAGTRKG